MWQVALAAAVAGSGILAKHLFTPQQQQQHEQNESRTSQQEEEEEVGNFDNGSEEQQQPDKDGIFMFSSGGSRSISNKKSKNVGGVVRRGKTMVGQKKKVVGKRVSVCLKKRKTGSGRTSSNERSSFGWGLGLGMMYMMSAGKAEVSKLSNAIDETTKVVNELKTQLSSQLESVYDATNTMDPKQKPKKKQENLNKEPIKAKDTNTKDFLSCVSNSLNMRMYERCEPMKPSSTTYQSGGVSPAVLKNKLSHLLIEQQESHILELESELNLAYSKLNEKDAELRALKDCVRHLTEFSLTSVSDEETDACREERRSLKKQDSEENKGSSATTTIGMKRVMDFETCSYEE